MDAKKNKKGLFGKNNVSVRQKSPTGYYFRAGFQRTYIRDAPSIWARPVSGGTPLNRSHGDV